MKIYIRIHLNLLILFMGFSGILFINRWSIPKSDWLYSLQQKMEKLYTVSKNKTGSSLCSDHELLIAKFRLRFITLYGEQWPKRSPRKGNARGQNGFLRRFYQIAEKRRSKRQGETERYTHLNAEFQSIVSKDKKAFLNAKK